MHRLCSRDKDNELVHLIMISICLSSKSSLIQQLTKMSKKLQW